MLRILKQRAINISKIKGHRLKHFEACGLSSAKSECALCGKEVTIRAKNVSPLSGEAITKRCQV